MYKDNNIVLQDTFEDLSGKGKPETGSKAGIWVWEKEEGRKETLSI